MTTIARQRVGRTRGLAAAVVATLLTLGASAGARAATYLKGEIDIQSITVPDDNTLHGYAEYPFEIRNHSKTETHTVTIYLPASDTGFGGDRLSSVSETVTLAPGGEARLSLLQPPLPVDGAGVGVRVDGRAQSPPLENRRFAHVSDTYGVTYGGSINPPTVLICKPLNDTEIGDTYDTIFGSTTTGTWGHTVSNRLLLRTERAPEVWPDRWLAYTRYDGVMIRPDEFRKLSDGARVALRNYIDAGGTLVVIGAGWDPPADWRVDRTQLTVGVVSYAPGMGKLLVVQQDDTKKWDRSIWTPLRQALSNSGKPWNKWYDVREANNKFRVVEELGVPVRGLFVLMLVFATLIGPVNLFVLGRMKRKIWMLWTVPAISLVACGAVFSYNLLAEGFTGQTRTQVITMLDQTRHHASTVGWTAFYSPLTPGGGLHFSADTEVTPLVGARQGESGRARTVDWTNDQHLGDGWVTARVPAHFMVRKAATARERLDFAATASGVTVTNGLGVDIKRLTYMDASGKTYQAIDVPAGQKVTLTDTALPVTRTRVDLRGVFASEWLNTCEQMVARPEAYLHPRAYIAVVPRSPFLEGALSGTDEWQTDSVVYGLVE
ncbi:MAG: hypothetical protein GC159_10780 [Phycisphaera sp.]|nr:hypothetical protein [Phycisphaera sp.]